MYDIKKLETDHKDVIHDIAFDFYGRRMATCSSDQAVKIWNLNDQGNWILSGTLKSHGGAVWKVTWCHPEYGQILAVCSFDKSAAIYQETVTEGGNGMQMTWIKQHTLLDARSFVTDIKFAPKAMGLMLATCSADGLVRVYRAYDVMNLSQWTPIHDINTRLPSLSCLAWNPSPSRICTPLLAVGSEDYPHGGGMNNTLSSPGTIKAAVYSFNDNGSRWDLTELLPTVTENVHDLAFAPNPGRSYHTLAIASNDLKIILLKPKPPSSDGTVTYDLQLAGQFDDHAGSVWRVSWNITGTVLTASGDNGLVKLYKANYLGVWKCVGTLSSSKAELPSASDVPEDSSSSTGPPLSFAAAVAGTKNTSNNANTARYFKMAPSSNPTHVPWH